MIHALQDMTGILVPAAPTAGTWTVEYDRDDTDPTTAIISWNSNEPSGSSLTVTVSSDSVPSTVVSNGDSFDVPEGDQNLYVSVAFARASGDDESPILYDLTILTNRPPECDAAYAVPDTLWPPNHKFNEISIEGVTDPDGDELTLTVTDIFQDEPLDDIGDGATEPDGQGVGTDLPEVRAERQGTGDGRVYHISFVADDGEDTCEGTVTVCVPHDRRPPGDVCVDGGPLYDSTASGEVVALAKNNGGKTGPKKRGKRKFVRKQGRNGKNGKKGRGRRKRAR